MHARAVSQFLAVVTRAVDEFEYQAQDATERQTITATLSVEYRPPTSYEKRPSTETTLRLSTTEYGIAPETAS